MSGFRQRVRFAVAVFALLFAPTLARADIPPPPPTVPGTGMPLPEAGAVVLTGIVLTLAIVGGGLALARLRGRPWSSVRRWVLLPATMLAVLTAGLALWSTVEHAAYARVRSNWRGNGPVRPRLPEPPPEPISAPAPAPEPNAQP